MYLDFREGLGWYCIYRCNNYQCYLKVGFVFIWIELVVFGKL